MAMIMTMQRKSKKNQIEISKVIWVWNLYLVYPLSIFTFFIILS